MSEVILAKARINVLDRKGIVSEYELLAGMKG